MEAEEEVEVVGEEEVEVEAEEELEVKVAVEEELDVEVDDIAVKKVLSKMRGRRFSPSPSLES